MKHPLYTCLWFDGQAKAAADFYCGIFKQSKITGNTPMVASFELNGMKFMGLNGGPNFKFNESVSFVIECDDQAEIDYYWDRLCEGGAESMCGWLKDKFGVSWQVIPAILPKLMSDPQKGPKVMQAFLKMKKFNIQALLDA